MLTMKTNYISHVLLLELKFVSRDRSMQGNLLNHSQIKYYLNILGETLLFNGASNREKMFHFKSCACFKGGLQRQNKLISS